MNINDEVFLQLTDRAGRINAIMSFDEYIATYLSQDPSRQKKVIKRWFETFGANREGLIACVDLFNPRNDGAVIIGCPLSLMEKISDKCVCGVAKTGGAHSEWCDVSKRNRGA